MTPFRACMCMCDNSFRVITVTLQRFRFDSLIPLHISSRKPAVNEAVITTVLLLMIRNLPKITASYVSSSFKFSHILAYNKSVAQ